MPRTNGELTPERSPRHLWGSEVRRYRGATGWSLDQVGKRVSVTGAHIGAIERGESPCKENLAKALDVALMANGALFALWEKTVKGSTWPDWFDWPVYEGKSTSIFSFQTTVVSGLLQTEDYARVLVGDDLSERLKRQEILTRDEPPPPHLSMILDASVLHRDIGGPDVMRAQCEHLLRVACRKVSIYVLPSTEHDGLSGSFVLARLIDGGEIGYIDTAVKGMNVTGKDALETLNRTFQSLQSQALSMSDSLAYIERMAEERWK